MNLSGRFALVPKRKLPDKFNIEQFIYQVVEESRLGSEETDYLKHDYEFESFTGREMKLFPKRKLVDLEGTSISMLFQHITSMIPKLGGMLSRTFDSVIRLAVAKAIVSVDRSYNKNVPLTREYKQAYDDAPADYIKRLTPAITSSKAGAIVTVNQSYNKNAPVGRDISILIDGAVSETAAGAQTDETAAARESTANDMHLCPMTPAVNDKYYFGFSKQYRRLWLNVSTAGIGNWANQVYYWNGDWISVADEDDQTSDFTVSGIKKIDWTMPGDWVQSIIQGMNLYWIKIETSSFVNQTQAPLGAQVWCCLAT